MSVTEPEQGLEGLRSEIKAVIPWSWHATNCSIWTTTSDDCNCPTYHKWLDTLMCLVQAEVAAARVDELNKLLEVRVSHGDPTSKIVGIMTYIALRLAELPHPPRTAAHGRGE